MSVIFNVSVPYALETKPFSGKVEILTNALRISYLNSRNLFQVETISIDTDLIKDLEATFTGTLTGSFLNLSGEITDESVIAKLGRGESIVNRGLFFTILKIHYLKIKGSKAKAEDFETVQDIFNDATSKISKVIADIRNGENFTRIPKPCIIKTNGLCYDTHDNSITVADCEEDSTYKTRHNSATVFLGDCLGKSSIGATVLANNDRGISWKVEKTKLYVGSSLVICDIQDLPVYTDTFVKRGITFLLIRTLKQFNSLTYSCLSSVNTVIFTSNFLSSLRQEKDLYPYNAEVNLDILLDLNLMSRKNIEINLVKFNLVVIDTQDSSKLMTRLSKLNYNCCVKFVSSSACAVPNSYDTSITLDYSLSTACKIKEFQTTVLKLTKKEKILMKACARKINVVSKDEFLISPECYADYCDIRTKIVSSVSEVSAECNFFDKSVECPICFSVCEDQIITYCGHSFCPECAENSFSKKPNCPLCRTEVRSGDYIYFAPKESLSSSGPTLYNEIISFCDGTVGKKIIHTSSRFTAHFLAQMLSSDGISSDVCCNIGKKLQPQLNAFSKNGCQVLITYLDEGQIKKFKISGVSDLLILPDAYCFESSKFITRMSRNGCDIHQFFT